MSSKQDYHDVLRRVVICMLVLAEVPDLLLEVALEEHSLITPTGLRHSL
jgi:hypothetical protein